MIDCPNDGRVLPFQAASLDLIDKVFGEFSQFRRGKRIRTYGAPRGSCFQFNDPRIYF
jgi:hypothetical protein